MMLSCQHDQNVLNNKVANECLLKGVKKVNSLEITLPTKSEITQFIKK